MREKEILNATISRQRETIHRLREEAQEHYRNDRRVQQRQALLGIIKSASVILTTICTMNLGWLAPNLAASIVIGATGCTIYSIIKLTHLR